MKRVTPTAAAELLDDMRGAATPATNGSDGTEHDRRASGVEIVRTPTPADPAAGPEPARSRPRRPWMAVIVGLAALALIAFGARQWWFGRSHVSTDNAQVDGHIIPILPRVSGYVAAVDVDENQIVRPGQVLVEIDSRDLRARLAQADADLQKEIANAGARGRSGEAAARLAAARAAVLQAQANAKKTGTDLKRYRALAAGNVVSQQELDAAEATAQAADAQLQAARDQVTVAGAAMVGAEARVNSANAARDQVALQLSYATVAAPAGGMVSKKSVEVGQLVQAGQPLMSVVPLDDVWIVANLKETEIKGVRTTDKVEITVDSYPGRKFAGHVESLSPATGAKFSLLPPDNATGNFTKVVQRVPTRIRLDDPQDPHHLLRPGMSVHVTITTG